MPLPVQFPECQIDSFSDRFGGLRHRVQPMELNAATHDQQIAIAQRDIDLAAIVMPMTQLEPAFGAENRRRNHRVRTQFRFVVGMPAHGIAAVAVEIGKHAIERLTGQCLGHFLDRVQGRWPGAGWPGQA